MEIGNPIQALDDKGKDDKELSMSPGGHSTGRISSNHLTRTEQLLKIMDKQLQNAHDMALYQRNRMHRCHATVQSSNQRVLWRALLESSVLGATTLFQIKLIKSLFENRLTASEVNA